MAEAPPVEVEYAGFWPRFAAAAMDLLLILLALLLAYVLDLVVVVAAATQTVRSNADAVSYAIGDIWYALVYLGPWLYFAFYERSGKRGTPGKQLLGIQVVDGAGLRVGFIRASVRFWAKLLSVLSCMVGFAFAAVTPRRQALHDLVAGTLVIRTRRAHLTPIATPSNRGLWLGAGLILALTGVVLGYLVLLYVTAVMRNVISNVAWFG